MASTVSELSTAAGGILGLAPPPSPPRPPALPTTPSKRRKHSRRRSSASPSTSGGAKLSALDAACDAAHALSIMTRHSTDLMDHHRGAGAGAGAGESSQADDTVYLTPSTPNHRALIRLPSEQLIKVSREREASPPSQDHDQTPPSKITLRINLGKRIPSDPQAPRSPYSGLMSSLDAILPTIKSIAEDDADYDRQSQIVTASLVILSNICKKHVASLPRFSRQSQTPESTFHRPFFLLRDVLHDAVSGYQEGGISTTRNLTKQVANARAHQKRWTWCDQTIKALRVNSPNPALKDEGDELRYLNVKFEEVWRKCDADVFARLLAHETGAPVPSVRVVQNLISGYSDLLGVLIELLHKST